MIARNEKKTVQTLNKNKALQVKLAFYIPKLGNDLITPPIS